MPPYILVYLFRRERGNVACECRTLAEPFYGLKERWVIGWDLQ